MVPLPVGKGAEEEITRKAGGHQALEKTEYLAQGCALHPACRSGGREGATRRCLKDPVHMGWKGREIKSGRLVRLLKQFRQEELRTWKSLAKVNKDRGHVRKTVKPWQVNRQESPGAI